MVAPELKSFRESRWRYSQFVVVALAAAGVIKWLSSAGWPEALGAGAAIGALLWLLEKKRGVI